MYTDTPVPPDEPYAENPPDGAVIDYYLKRDAAVAATLEILTSGRARGAEVLEHRCRRAGEGRRQLAVVLVPAGAGALDEGRDCSGTRGICISRAPAGECSLPISATPHNTKCEPEGIWAQPGQYTAKLTVDGKSYTQSFTVRMDPRVKATAAALQQQYSLSLAL